MILILEFFESVHSLVLPFLDAPMEEPLRIDPIAAKRRRPVEFLVTCFRSARGLPGFLANYEAVFE